MKDKAKELVDRFRGISSGLDYQKDGYVYDEKIRIERAKQCALICVDEIIEAYNNTMKNGQLDSDNCYFIHKYWQGVKQEIEKLNN